MTKKVDTQELNSLPMFDAELARNVAASAEYPTEVDTDTGALLYQGWKIWKWVGWNPSWATIGESATVKEGTRCGKCMEEIKFGDLVFRERPDRHFLCYETLSMVDGRWYARLPVEGADDRNICVRAVLVTAGQKMPPSERLRWAQDHGLIRILEEISDVEIALNRHSVFYVERDF